MTLCFSISSIIVLKQLLISRPNEWFILKILIRNFFILPYFN
jgi:hypothetical protein